MVYDFEVGGIEMIKKLTTEDTRPAPSHGR
jgi:hypothetical protein